MQRIVAIVTTIDPHLEAVGTTPDIYRPDACPHCRRVGLWRHACYHRKADRGAGGESRNPVAVLRFLCRECLRTCSRLPLCIAPRRWYDWAVQQAVLGLLLFGCSVRRCSVAVPAGRGETCAAGETGSMRPASTLPSCCAAGSPSWVVCPIGTRCGAT